MQCVLMLSRKSKNYSFLVALYQQSPGFFFYFFSREDIKKLEYTPLLLLHQDDSDVVGDGSYPPNYWYGNCVESDDEVEDFEYEDENEDGLDDAEEEDYDDEDGIIC